MVWYVSYIVTQTSTKVLERVQREATPPAPQTVWWACALAHPRVGPPPPRFGCRPPAGPTWVGILGLLLSSGPSAAALFPPALCREQVGLVAVRCFVPPAWILGTLITYVCCNYCLWLFSFALSVLHFYVGVQKNPQMVLASLAPSSQNSCRRPLRSTSLG